MSQKPPAGKDAFPVTKEAFRVRAEIDLDAFYTRLLNETRRQYTDLSQAGYKGDELADRLISSLNDLSDVPIEQASRGATAEAFNLGRNLEAQESAAQVQRVVRTEILDEDTCKPCFSLDFLNSGKVYELNSPEYFHDMPPNLCEGRELCRGFYVYLA